MLLDLQPGNAIINDTNAQLFENAVSDAARNDFVYFDSPYVPVSQTASFTKYTKNNFNLDDHKRLAKLCDELSERDVKIMLSNNNVSLIHELYASYNIVNVDVKRNINSNASKKNRKRSNNHELLINIFFDFSLIVVYYYLSNIKDTLARVKEIKKGGIYGNDGAISREHVPPVFRVAHNRNDNNNRQRPAHQKARDTNKRCRLPIKTSR